MSELQVPKTILDQLGGRQFIAMTGAKNLVGSKDLLSFKLPDRFAKNKINAISIRLEPSDTYTLTFARTWGLRYAVIDEVADVHAEDLRDVFTGYTGLDCTLGTLGAV